MLYYGVGVARWWSADTPTSKPDLAASDLSQRLVAAPLIFHQIAHQPARVLVVLGSETGRRGGALRTRTPRPTPSRRLGGAVLGPPPQRQKKGTAVLAPPCGMLRRAAPQAKRRHRNPSGETVPAAPSTPQPTSSSTPMAGRSRARNVRRWGASATLLRAACGDASSGKGPGGDAVACGPPLTTQSAGRGHPTQRAAARAAATVLRVCIDEASGPRPTSIRTWLAQKASCGLRRTQSRARADARTHRHIYTLFPARQPAMNIAVTSPLQFGCGPAPPWGKCYVTPTARCSDKDRLNPTAHGGGSCSIHHAKLLAAESIAEGPGEAPEDHKVPKPKSCAMSWIL